RWRSRDFDRSHLSVCVSRTHAGSAVRLRLRLIGLGLLRELHPHSVLCPCCACGGGATVMTRAAERIGTVLRLWACAFPLYWMLVASLTPESRLFGVPQMMPHSLGLEHYRALFG